MPHVATRIRRPTRCWPCAREHRLAASDLRSVTALVHQAAIDVLGPVTDPRTVHQAKFSMGTVLGLAAVHGGAGLNDFDAHYQDAAVRAVHDKVAMRLDAGGRCRVSRALDRQGAVVEIGDGRCFEGSPPVIGSEGRPRQHAEPRGARGQGDAARGQTRRTAIRN